MTNAREKIFEARQQDGKTIIIWSDGHTEGFPPNTTVVNYFVAQYAELTALRLKFEADRLVV